MADLIILFFRTTPHGSSNGWKSLWLFKVFITPQYLKFTCCIAYKKPNE